MKRTFSPFLRLLSWGAGSLLVLAAAAASAQTLSFEGAGDVGQLTQVGSSTGTAITSLSYTAGVGTGGSGGLVNSTADVTATYTGSSYNLATGTGYTFSIDMQRPSSNGNGQQTLLQLGLFASSGIGTGTSTQYVTFKLVGPGITGTSNLYQMQLQNWDSSQPAATGVGSSFTIATASTDWYRLVGTLTLTNATTHTFSYSFSYLDLGAAGTSTPTVVASASGTLVNASLAADTSLWLGFRDVGTSWTALDNLSIAPVPEPASAWLLLPGAVFAVAASRRLRPVRS